MVSEVDEAAIVPLAYNFLLTHTSNVFVSTGPYKRMCVQCFFGFARFRIIIGIWKIEGL